ncbi:glutathione S-transferase N-terminal domain-containing protein [Hydrogenophaga sp.]|uniref:glutathione S-transferase N-terminal domain-containing protein n=1 Tax=Hydrogenophaga sp. TaxID=1904254 RepID=UPI00272F25FC|nr:glutathione S-transferase N-terminal domain-containing protein [Hydrogenophaga sp.]MDP2019117.1 glutathione S-transferase N-terminal domain-containing protein [Hydrogenophaga sp.]MDP3167836.1 glutathione S-transferase N-terminal domain-containing protein [Hydrogenophaga sp.]
MLPILYSFRRCPYAIRARLALCQAGVAVELREVALSRKPAELLAASPAGTVPVLQIEPGQVIAQSLDIMRWALGQNDAEGWLVRADSPGHQALVDTCDGDFKQALDRYKYAERHPQRSTHEWREEAVHSLIAPLETRLAEAPHLGGARPCLADAAIFPFVRQFAAVDVAWWAASPWTATRRWHDAWADSKLMDACMHKAAPWQPGAPVTVFPPGAA